MCDCQARSHHITVTTITACTANVMCIEDVKKIDNKKRKTFVTCIIYCKYVEQVCGKVHVDYMFIFKYSCLLQQDMWFLNSAGIVLQFHVQFTCRLQHVVSQLCISH